MRYAHTQVASDRASAWKTFESLERLGQLSGVRGLIGRTFFSPEEVAGEGINGGANGATAGCGVDGEGNWHASTTFPGWVWKGDTSSVMQYNIYHLRRHYHQHYHHHIIIIVIIILIIIIIFLTSMTNTT